MKAKVAFALVLLCACLIAGCSYSSTSGGQLYPVQGPLAALAPAPVYDATITVSSKSGTSISLVLANGETFGGAWGGIVESSVNAKTPGAPAAYPPQPNLSFAWDAIYGQGDFVAHILGRAVGHAVLTGSQGTALQVEIQGHRGVAVDNRGNLYKVVW
ncbi:MAG: hypothetical protein P4L26_04790 [Terracidiphilus sp.]|jgi:hypothetical protein|nr:hypothetical protein [Terracidiphilus sp.]